MKKTVSIIIANFNTKQLIIECLRSIEKEIGDISFEVILVDNGSNDGSVEVIKKLSKEKYWQDKLQIIYNKANLGYARANNQGIKEAKGEYLLLLNSDAVIRPNSVKRLIDFAKETTDAGVVGPKLLNVDGSVQASCYHFPSITNAVKEYWYGQKGFFEKYSPAQKTSVAVDSVVGAAFLITPKARKKVGLLDERYFAYFEDIDYCRRVWKIGLKVYYFPESTIVHHHGASFEKLSAEKERWKKLIPGSKIYHGLLKYYLIYLILWLGQKKMRILRK